uniref:Ribonuclease H-like domain-containing protein n=1 Tax=Tanacetum cinerariifolium TaxID=118510 RepID=A0A6L2L907_TANCI|nr:ribonuclease H-like domain-containing protein [Tanacetum cinerariifolium]
MGHDDIYNVVRFQILTIEPLPDVKYAFATLSKVESHKNNLVYTSFARPSSSVFVSNNRPNTWSNNRNSQNKGTSRNNNLVCKHCHITGHTIDRCFKLNGYPSGFKKKNYGGSNVSNNASSSSVKSDQSAGNPSPFTLDQINRIMALTGSKSDSVELQSCVVVNKYGDPYNDKRDNRMGDNDGITSSPDFADVSTDTPPIATCHLEEVILESPNRPNNSSSYGLGGSSVSLKFNIPKSLVLRRSSRQHRMPAKFDSYVLDKKVKTFADVANDPRWVEAMNQEIEALNNNNTWEITKLPNGRKAICRKWIFKVKYKANGEVKRFKERLVAKGFGQKEGIDYEETFFPVVKIVTVRCLLIVDVRNKRSVYQLDVNNVFLYGELTKDVYMQLPDGYFTDNDNKVCKLTKSLYGLKQAPRRWNEKLTLILNENGFILSKSDTSLYTKSNNKVFIILLVYVDDIIVTRNNENEIIKFKEYLSSMFDSKDLGKLKYFLGIEVLKTKDGMCLNQKKYCLELLLKYGMLACKPAKASIPDQSKKRKDKTEPIIDHAIGNITYYQKIVGKLVYLSMTRPYIAYVVHNLSQFMHAPCQSHLKLAFHVLRYLKGSPSNMIMILACLLMLIPTGLNKEVCD